MSYTTGGVFNVWVSNGSNWSSNQSDWTQLVTNGTWSQGQSALIDMSGQPRSGLLMGSFGPRTENWTGNIDYIAWSNQTSEQTPWSFNLSGLGLPGPASLPGIIQAEDYDQGGEGVAYHDTTAGNAGGAYRSDDVDIEGCADTGGGYDVGFIDAGEWLRYTVNVTQAGDYDISVRVATTQATGSFHIELNGVNVTGTQTFTGTGDWQTWTTSRRSQHPLQRRPTDAEDRDGVRRLELELHRGRGAPLRTTPDRQRHDPRHHDRRPELRRQRSP